MGEGDERNVESGLEGGRGEETEEDELLRKLPDEADPAQDRGEQHRRASLWA